MSSRIALHWVWRWWRCRWPVLVDLGVLEDGAVLGGELLEVGRELLVVQHEL